MPNANFTYVQDYLNQQKYLSNAQRENKYNREQALQKQDQVNGTNQYQILLKAKYEFNEAVREMNRAYQRSTYYNDISVIDAPSARAFTALAYYNELCVHYLYAADLQPVGSSEESVWSPPTAIL